MTDFAASDLLTKFVGQKPPSGAGSENAMILLHDIEEISSGLFRNGDVGIWVCRDATLDPAHDVSEQRADLVREVLTWLDRYLGRTEAAAAQ